MENDKITVKVKGGVLAATVSSNLNYPGIDVEVTALMNMSRSSEYRQ